MSTYQYKKTLLTNKANPTYIQTVLYAASPYSASISLDDEIDVNCSSGSVVINLPQISSLPLNNRGDKGYYIKRTENNGNYTVTIAPYSRDTIDGGASFVLPISTYDYVFLVSDITTNNWVVVDTNVAPS